MLARIIDKPHIALLFGAIFAGISFHEASSSDLSNLEGCWQRNESTTRCDKPYNAYQRLCFERGAKVTFISISPDGANTESLDWVVKSDDLIIDGQTCALPPGDNKSSLILTRCLYRGLWFKLQK